MTTPSDTDYPKCTNDSSGYDVGDNSPRATVGYTKSLTCSYDDAAVWPGGDEPRASANSSDCDEV